MRLDVKIVNGIVDGGECFVVTRLVDNVFIRAARLVSILHCNYKNYTYSEFVLDSIGH
jgi:hypothetical protein